MSLLTSYHSKIQNGKLDADPNQAQAVEVLERLYKDIVTLQAREDQGFFQKLKSIRSTMFQAKILAPKGVYVYGGVGRGKSMVMDLFFDTIPAGITKRRVHFHEFMISVHNHIHSVRLNEKSGRGVDIAIPILAKNIAKSSRVLCFDEFHVTDIADAMILGRLFTALFHHGVIIVATSNWKPDSLYKDGLQRDRVLPFIALLKERMEIVHLNSETDYREKIFSQYTQKECNYFTPLSDTTRGQVDQLFAYVSGRAPVEEVVLDVKGRRIVVQRAAAGVARFTFAQLCERPYGAEDYLTLTQTFHTVFLEDVPRLTYDRRNEAKRMMVLVDALYEAKTNFIISAAAPPAELYSGSDHAFEFERTVSRLLEMQARDYNDSVLG